MSEAKERLHLPTERKEKIVIKTFGSNEKSVLECDVVKVDLQTKKAGVLRLDALVVPFICEPLNLPENLGRHTDTWMVWS